MAKVPDTQVNVEKCICPRCPTFLASECAKSNQETLYCARGKSGCDLVDHGCLCGMCPLWDEFSLSKGYFCLNGSAE